MHLHNFTRITLTLFIIYICISLIVNPISADILQDISKNSLLRPLASANGQGAEPIDAEFSETDDSTAMVLAGSSRFLPIAFDQNLRRAAIASSSFDYEAASIMGNEELIAALAATPFFKDADEVRATIRTILWSEDADASTAANRLCSGLNVCNAKPEAMLAFANMLIDKNNKLPSAATLRVVCKILGKFSSIIATNLENLFSDNPDRQAASFSWIFKNALLVSAEAMRQQKPDKFAQLLVAQLIFKLLTRVMADMDNEKYARLRDNIIIAFSQRVSDEINGPKETKPLIAELVTYCEEVAKEFFVSIVENFLVSTAYHTYTAEAAQSLLSFACIQWPDYFYEYLQGKCENVKTYQMLAHFLYAMSFAAYPGRSQAPDPERAKTVLVRALSIVDEADKEAQEICKKILTAMPDAFVAYISEGGRYERLNPKKRKVLFDVLFNIGTKGNLENGRMRVVGFLMHDLLHKNLELIQQLTFFRSFVDEDLIKALDSEAPQTLDKLVNFIICNYTEFSGISDINAACERILTRGGFHAIQLTHRQSKHFETARPDLSQALFLICAKAISEYQTENADEIAFIDGITRGVVTQYAGAVEKLSRATKIFKQHQSKVLALKTKCEALEAQVRNDAPQIEKFRAEISDSNKPFRKFQQYVALYNKRLEGLQKELKDAIADLDVLERALVYRDETMVRATVKDIEARKKQATAKIKELEQKIQALVKEITAAEDALRQTDGVKADMEKKRRIKQHESNVTELAALRTQLSKATGSTEMQGVLEGIKESGGIIASHTAVVLRLLLSSPSMPTETLRDAYSTFMNEEKQELLTSLSVALNPRFQKENDTASLAKTETALAGLMALQSQSMEFEEVLISELEFLTDLAQKGKFIPKDINDPLLIAVAKGLTETYYNVPPELSWHRSVNNRRLGFLIKVFERKGAEPAVKAYVEGKLWEVSAKWMADLKTWDSTGILNIDVINIVAALGTYFKLAENPRNMAMFAFYFANKVNACCEKITQRQIMHLERIRETFNIIKERLPQTTYAKTKDGEKLLAPVLDEALRKTDSQIGTATGAIRDRGAAPRTAGSHFAGLQLEIMTDANKMLPPPERPTERKSLPYIPKTAASFLASA